jgi:hypothetical protein
MIIAEVFYGQGGILQTNWWFGVSMGEVGLVRIFLPSATPTNVLFNG